MAAAVRINPRTKLGKSGQGFYVLGWDATPYAHTNRRGGDVAAFARRSLASFRRNPPGNKMITSSAMSHARPLFPGQNLRMPHGVHVVGVYSRIRPVPKGAAAVNRSIGRDFLWIYPDEVEHIERNTALPATLVQRIARYHLIDNIRGEPDFWLKGEVLATDFRVQGSDGKYQFSGPFHLASSCGKREFKGNLQGEVRIVGGKVESFRAYASGKARGRGTWTPGQPKGWFPLVIAMTDASSAMIPPSAIAKAAPYSPTSLKNEG